MVKTYDDTHIIVKIIDFGLSKGFENHLFQKICCTGHSSRKFKRAKASTYNSALNKPPPW